MGTSGAAAEHQPALPRSGNAALLSLGKNKVGFVDGTVKRSQFTGDLTRLWDRCNAIVVSWILCNVTKDLHSGVLFCSDTHLMREDLKERFNKGFHDHLQHQHMLRFHGLNDNYSQAVSQILLMPHLPASIMYAMINRDESQLSGGINPQRPKKPYNPNTVRDFCHMKGHLRIDCLKLLNCDFCHKTGHLKLNFYKLNGYPPHYKGKEKLLWYGNSMYDRRVT
ncbi:hypothetical protein H5410_023938 [Solanum commersonii]|uniref:Uncharacterized protein n=1 Tax=Solanum commersonii TaxID=4109 RepID=A0A9J5ZKK3_SOLCO|nr:hypothetical protein H5410_023938 [Solanum commersonii]